MIEQARVIKTEGQYQSYLSEVQSLLLASPEIGSEDSERLELLTVLLENYENQKYPVEAPDPIAAIKFRMQEKGLKQADLIPYFGTRSRVSEVLSGKRPLTLQMIRALSVGLGISAETLIGLPEKERPTQQEIDWSRFPAKEMVARGWIQKAAGRAKRSIEDQVQEFISQIGWQLGDAAFKRSISGEAFSPTTKYSLYAWLSRVIQKARERKQFVGKYDESALSNQTLRELAQLSWFEDGPKLAIEYLEKIGICIVVEPHLKGTMLDGAALKDTDGTPVIGLTIRHDRLDNFWFTLLHEVVHIWKHVGEDDTFMDDLDSSASTDKREAEANRLAREALIPRVSWKRSQAYLSPSKEAIDELSRKLKVSPAIIAGRIRREKGNYRLFADLVGHGEVSKVLFNRGEEGEK
ncbi:ImmA/IrrE family metallo-endopeptidase [Marinobacter shengliensis]|uniref:ImmA/IrrE family metallo-endopeptidase n=1 Tax=Marinobacter shengliensis TaxID=1389223 RepID=UPI0035BB096F